jgi:hypothetical protein
MQQAASALTRAGVVKPLQKFPSATPLENIGPRARLIAREGAPKSRSHSKRLQIGALINLESSQDSGFDAPLWSDRGAAALSPTSSSGRCAGQVLSALGLAAD